ncbi:MAG: peptidoglycan DD-metalloendopeptidase family protein [Candidatus Rokubacteria bacterium]|nr:peptidoglycan DD-metalloendopeptidase family protein [Candidatus Rokubacteria bacterium]
MNRAVLAVGVLVALLLPLGGAPARAQRGGEIGEKERALQQAQHQLKAERAKAAAARKREQSVLAELEAIDKSLAGKRRQIAGLDARVRKAQAQIVELQGDIRRLETRRGGQEEALARRLQALYKLHSQGGALPVLLSGDDPVERAVRLRHLATLTRVDAGMIREYRANAEGLADRKAKVEVSRAELASLREQVERERAEADREAARRRVLLAKVRDERTYHDRMVGELSDATRRLEAFIRDLQAKQRRMARTPPAAPAPGASRATPGDVGASAGSGSAFAGLRGRLLWPADGKVVVEFGPQVHPRFGTRTFRNGIDIAVSEGTTIQAVHAGLVVYTGWFRGYGNLIILDHGGEYYTLYAHAADIRVAEGDDVKQGQPLGTVGDTGSPQGPRLYFEVRHQGKPQDPAHWLRPRS